MKTWLKIMLMGWLVGLPLGAGGPIGCAVEQKVTYRNPWNDMFRSTNWYDDSGGGGDGNREQVRGSGGYSIELARFTGTQGVRQAPSVIRTARFDGGLADIWYVSNADRTTVYSGRFASLDSPSAKAQLRRVQQTEIDGQRPFEDARLVALSGDRSMGTTDDQRDLRSLSGRGLFTLQIGYYDRAYGDDFRKAAEDRVDELRAQDEDAYYYHGPNRSLILVNAWTRPEAFLSESGQMDRYSSEVLSVQQRFPHNVPNGRPFTARDDPEFVRSQHSFLVAVR